MQACAEASPSSKHLYHARIQALIAEHFGEGPEARAKYQALMADEEVKKATNNWSSR